ncbi:hypothetical protein GCM10022419_054360 [Nonomuraea rosea]|uniref:OmpR/PhoB-type domain-containing protein n=1 Tax=Nonomuraea rosea TaxID=638574 RepID=A0ABP6XGE7_9ACTN
MRYEILGPLRVVDGGASSFISARKVETLLATLLIRSDQVVSIEQLETELWGDKTPRRAIAALHVYISQLRKFLAREGSPDSAVVTRPPGYLLRMGDAELDFQIFERYVQLGRAHVRRHDHEQAVTCFEDALALWRGPALEDLRTGPIIEGFVIWLNEVRMECIEMLIDSQMELGRHRELIGRLYALVMEYPLRETFYRQLMLALYRAERQGDALQVYQRARATLTKELGLEPCKALQELHSSILLADDRLMDMCAYESTAQSA